MEYCPHTHEPDKGLQAFRDIIREETNGGRDITQFFVNTMFDDAYRYLDGPWSYMRAIHSSGMAYHTLAADRHDLFFYDSDLGRYVPGEDRVRKVLADSMELEWSPTRVNDILIWYKDSAPRLWDAPPLDRVNVLNGILHLESGDLEPHSPDFLSPVQINAAWDPEAECPAIDQFVQRVFPYDAHEVFYQLGRTLPHPQLTMPESRPLPRLQAPAAVARASPSHSSGPSSDLGTSPTSLCTTSPRAAAPSPSCEASYSTSQPTSPERDFDDTTVFKQIVDGQLAVLRAPRKYRDPIEFQPFTRLLASAARVPQSADNSLGYLRRWLAVPFDTTLNESNLDRTLLDKLTTPEELSGLLNRAVAEHRQLLESGRLTESEKMARAKDEFDQASDSTRLFLEERVEECSPYDEIDRTDLYNAYKDWCIFNRISPVGPHRLYKSVWDIFRVDTHKRRDRRVLQGLQFVKEDSEST